MAKKNPNKGKDDSEKKKPAKKKPVGRPKKRGRKVNYYKRAKKKKNQQQKGSHKGFSSNTSYNRVRALLWKEHKDEFSSYREFISNKVDADGKKIAGSSPVSQVYRQCKTLDCTDEDILLVYNQSHYQKKDDDQPILPSDYFEPRPFWHLLTEDIWDGMDDRVWVQSETVSDEGEFLGVLGEDRYVNKDNEQINPSEYDKDKGDSFLRGNKTRFQPFVDYANMLQAGMPDVQTDEVPHVKFQSKDGEPETYWNPELGRWEVDLVVCNSLGDVESYGFDPSLSEQDFEGYEPPTAPEPKKDKKEDKPDKREKIDKEIELEKEKRKTSEQAEKTAKAQAKADEKKAIADITSQFAKGKLTKKEMMDIIKAIKS